VTDSGSDATNADAGEHDGTSDGASSDGSSSDGSSSDGSSSDGSSTDGSGMDGSDGSSGDAGARDGGVVAHKGEATVSGGVRATSPSYVLVTTTGEAPGGNGTMSSPSYRLTGGLVSATQGN
jgi:hypothetical protein